MFRIYALNKDQKSLIDKVLSDDIMGRQTVIQKDGSTLGYDEKIILVVEGQAEIFPKLDNLFENMVKPMPEKEASVVYKKIKDEEEAAQSGVGFLFGP